MDLMPLARILWGRRLIILVSTLSCLLGGLFVIATAPPLYQASSQVLLNFFKPDPITGFGVSSKGVDAYVTSQIRLIEDVQVAARVVDALGWPQNPELLAAYDTRAPGDQREFHEWAAPRIIGATSAGIVGDTNILEIRFVSGSPEFSKAVADDLRQAYIDANTASPRGAALATAQQLQKVAKEAQTKLLALQTQKSQLERESGVILQDTGQDLDNARLDALAGSARPFRRARQARANKAAADQLAILNTKVATATLRYGANNPTFQALRTRRDSLAAQLELSQNSRMTSAVNATQAQEKIHQDALNQQIAKVISQTAARSRLQLVQDQISALQKEYATSTQGANKLMQLTTVNMNTVQPIGEAVLRRKPVFPNKTLIIGGSTGFGLLIGLLLALLSEMMGRRVRSIQDLQKAAGAPLMGVVPQVRASRGTRRWRISAPTWSRAKTNAA